jgi:hypothetical protein
MIQADVSLAALSMDLKRVALALYAHSDKVADRFIHESLEKKNRIDVTALRPHVRRLLTNLDTVLAQKDKEKLAEDALLYSTLLQNAALLNR